VRPSSFVTSSWLTKLAATLQVVVVGTSMQHDMIQRWLHRWRFN
jgi:hypothetical protein